MSNLLAETLVTQNDRTSRRSYKALAAGLAMVAGTSLGISASAEAQAPVTNTSEINNTFVNDCGDFTMTEHHFGEQTTRHSPSGRQQTHLKIRSEFTNNVTGESLETVTPFKITFSEGEVTMTGLVYRLNEPGEGVVSIDSGRTVFDQATGEIIRDDGRSDNQANLCETLRD